MAVQYPSVTFEKEKTVGRDMITRFARTYRCCSAKVLQTKLLASTPT